MKSSNLAWRIEPFEEQVAAPPAQSSAEPPQPGRPEPARARPRFERRRIEIRDQGFAPFRIR